MPDRLEFPPLAQAATRITGGSYSYSGGVGAEGITEQWSKYQLPDGELLTVSTREVADPAITLRAQTRHFEDEMCEAWFEFQGDVTVRANYIFGEEGHLLLRHQIGDAAITEQKIDASECDLLFPLLRVYTGSMLRAILEDGGSAKVLIPRIDCMNEPENLLRASFSERSAESLGEDLFDIDGSQIPCEKVLFKGGPYIDGAECYLASEVLLAYEWEQSDGNRWRVELDR